MFEKVVIPFETVFRISLIIRDLSIVIPFETVFRISLIIRDLSIRPKLKGLGLLEQGSWA